MKLFISDKVNSKTNCPRCNSRLQNEYQSYVIAVKEEGETQHLTIGCKGGYFCPECPTVVLDSQPFEEIISQNAQRRTVEYAIFGMIDIDAVDEDKQDIPLGEDDNPIPIIEFEHAYSTTSDRKKKIGRNDPCPCGSGKKYKYCCMSKS